MGGLGVGKDDFSMQIWKFHAISSKEKFVNWPTPLRWRACKHTFLCSSWHFMYFLAGHFLVNWPYLTIWRVRAWQNEVLCADLDISCTFHQNNFLVKWPVTPYLWQWGLLNCFVHFMTFNVISNRENFIEWGPNFTCQRETSIVCVLEIVFGGLLQISQATICCLRDFL